MNRPSHGLSCTTYAFIPDSSIETITSEYSHGPTPMQAVTLPPRFCDSRVKVMQADAREVSPMVFQVGGSSVEAGYEVHCQQGLAAIIIVWEDGL